MIGISSTARSVRLALAASMVLTVGVLGAASVAAGSAPTIIHGAKVGPVAIPATRRNVARLALPQGGWQVIVKAQLVSSGTESHHGVQCRLKVGKRMDNANASPGRKGTWRSRMPMLLSIAGRLSSPGNAVVSCVGEVGGAVTIRDIRMTAIKAGRLFTLNGTAKETGKGTPYIISKKGPATVSLWGDGSPKDVDWLGLPAGRWWIIAKAVYQGGVNRAYSCRLEAGGDWDEVEFTGALAGKHGDRLPLGLQVVHHFPADGFAALTCQTAPTTNNHSFDMGQVTITAVEVGKLTNRNLAADTQSSWGSGAPRVISGWHNGPLGIPRKTAGYKRLTSLSLPWGRWSVLAKLWVDTESGTTDHAGLVTCRLVFGSVADEATIDFSKPPSWASTYGLPQPMALAISYSSIEPGPVELRCRRAKAGGPVKAYFIKITAIKAGSLTRKPL